MKVAGTFHLGLCMAGSITAGAYTAGVVDYLIEALEEWEKRKNEQDVPAHQVVIDLLCGSSGGGMTGAMTLFALMDKMDHAKLEEDGISYLKPDNNILWKSWVELDGEDMIRKLLSNEDILPQQISSLLNSSFIDRIGDDLEQYIASLPGTLQPPAFVGPAPEMFMTLFNVTGINYELRTRSTSSSKGVQYVSDHRDLAHFRWTSHAYPLFVANEDSGNSVKTNSACDGRIPVSLKNREHISILIDGAKATGAFPVGLKARIVKRPAKFIWDNPFFHKQHRFNNASIKLGDEITEREQEYKSLNSDGGTANNEPVELAREILLDMREKLYKDVAPKANVESRSEAEQTIAVKQNLDNTSVIMIDPFPSLTNEVTVPDTRTSDFPAYAWKLIKAMNSQMIFDAKDAMDAYSKESYGLHIISPSRDGVEPKHAIACGSLAGFGGFLNREFRVHDFFLGRRNCQSFLRKYFVARLDEPDAENRASVQAVVDAYAAKPHARERFASTDENGIKWLPIIPDFSVNTLPLYVLKKFPHDFLHPHVGLISKRYMAIANNLIPGNFLQKLMVKIFTALKRRAAITWILKKITDDLLERELIENKSRE